MKIKDDEILSYTQNLLSQLLTLIEYIHQFNRIMTTITDGFQDEKIIDQLQKKKNEIKNLVLILESVYKQLRQYSDEFVREIDIADRFIY